MKFFQNVIFLGFVLLCFYLYSLVDHSVHPITVSDDALAPDMHLENARLYTKEHANQRSLLHLEKAIESMKKIEDEIDEKGKESIELAIQELNVVYDEVLRGEVNDSDLRNAFIRAFNSLTYAELKVSEALINSDMKSDAMIALGYGKVHIKNALKFTDGETFSDELNIYSRLDSLLVNDLTDEEILLSLNAMIRDMDRLREK